SISIVLVSPACTIPWPRLSSVNPSMWITRWSPPSALSKKDISPLWMPVRSQKNTTKPRNGSCMPHDRRGHLLSLGVVPPCTMVLRFPCVALIVFHPWTRPDDPGMPHGHRRAYKALSGHDGCVSDRSQHCHVHGWTPHRVV